MTYDVEHLFMCLFSICLSYLWRSILLKALAHLSLGFLLIVEFKFFLYILNNDPLSDVSFANIFFQSVFCFPIILLLSLMGQKKLNFNEF